jgi:hypothetical protein
MPVAAALATVARQLTVFDLRVRAGPENEARAGDRRWWRHRLAKAAPAAGPGNVTERFGGRHGVLLASGSGYPSQYVFPHFCRKPVTTGPIGPGAPIFSAFCPTVSLLPQHRFMSPLACAIEHRFEEVCRAELVRLGRKTASLSATHRAEVHAITVEVARSIAAHLASRLEPDTPPEVCNIIGRLFNLGPDGDGR